jgi:hypothetical protein
MYKISPVHTINKTLVMAFLSMLHFYTKNISISFSSMSESEINNKKFTSVEPFFGMRGKF